MCEKHYRQVRDHGHILTGDYLSEQGKKARAKSSGSKGKHWSEEARANYSEKSKGIRKNTGKTHFKEGFTPWNKGTSLAFLTNENNHNWKGDKVGLSGLHSWIKRRLGRPKECWSCGFTSDNPNMLNWANKSHQYKRDLNDWLRLCAKCHKNYDMGKLTLTEIGV